MRPRELPGHGAKALGADAGQPLYDQQHAHAVEALRRQRGPFVMVLSGADGDRIMGVFVETGTLPTEDDFHRAASSYLRHAAEQLTDAAEYYEAKISG
jgi:hypothetical protein